MLKPVLPQLQTTFVKALNDKTLAVREKAVEALTLFTTLHAKVDLLFTELRNGIQNNEDSAVRWVCCLFVCLFVCLVGWLVGWFVCLYVFGWLVGLFVCLFVCVCVLSISAIFLSRLFELYYVYIYIYI